MLSELSKSHTVSEPVSGPPKNQFESSVRRRRVGVMEFTPLAEEETLLLFIPRELIAGFINTQYPPSP